jgi:1-carboxybiuret hydrolase
VTTLDDATAIAAAVRAGQRTACDVLDETLARARTRGSELNCFGELLEQRARVEALAVDRAVAAGDMVGPLAGVPFAVKDLFDVRGVVTRAGSRINLDHPPAGRDAAAVELLSNAGGTLIGTTVADEYAYGFTTENTHYGAVHNPLDEQRIAGGSSGGSAAAVSEGIVPLAIGSDTNGSVRVPAALCGVLGLKPTYGVISRRGLALFAASFDHVGLFGRSVRDIRLGQQLLRGDAVRASADAAAAGSDARNAIAGGHLRGGAHPGVL